MTEKNTLNTLYKNIAENRDLRKSLSGLKMALRDQAAREELDRISGKKYDPLLKCLADEDPKVRKNAAAVLGELGLQESMPLLMDAWEAEETLFVRPEYLKALSRLSCRPCVPVFQERLQRLREMTPGPEQAKHVREEMNALSSILQKYGMLEKHRFAGFRQTNDVLLRMHPAFTGLVEKQITERRRAAKGRILVRTDRLGDLLRIRPVREFLFLTACRTVPRDPRLLAQSLLDYGLDIYIRERLKGGAPYFFRVDLLEPASPQKSAFLKKTADEIGKAFTGDFVNLTGGYEFEILFAPKRDGTLLPLIRFCTLPDGRFLYRKKKMSQGIRPDMAAGLLELARPYLKPGGQVLDPFCSDGTFLIERNYLLPARSLYGVDRYGDAIEAARENTASCGMTIHFVHRDFLDFTHTYLFDEILADMPGGFQNREEKDAFYRRFLEKSQELLADGGVILCRSAEMGILKKQLRLHGRLHLEQEILLNPKSGESLFILRYVR